MIQSQPLSTSGFDLEAAIAALERDYEKLAPRLRALDHDVTCECEGVTLRLHFPSFRQGKATVFELTEAIFHYLVPFCLPRRDVEKLHSLYGKLSADEYDRQNYD